jgi:hypothetical protein
MLSIFRRRAVECRVRTRPIAFDSLECRLAPAGDFGLAFHPGGPNGTAVIQALTTPDGPVIAGYFTGTVNFNPGPGTYNLTSSGGRDIFIASYDRMGRFQWAKDIGGTGNDQANAVVTDGFSTVLANYGGFNVYVTGSFQGTVNFNPGGTAQNLTAQGTSDAFIASFDSSGNFRWADDLGGSGGNDQGLGVTYDSSSRPYVVVSGSFTNTINFYPSIPTAYLQQPLISAGGTDGFICKLVPDGTWDDTMIGGSTESWAEQIGGSGDDAITAVAAGGSGYYLTGYFSGTANLNPHPGFADYHTSAGGTDGFVMQVNSLQGIRLFLTTFGGPGDDRGTSIGYGWDSNNSNLPPLLFVGGSFQDTVDFSGGVGTGNLTSAGGSDAFVARYNSGTGALDWIRGAGGVGNDATNALAVAFHGVAAAGSYTGTANFAGPTGTFDLNDAGQGSGFLWSLDANGNFLYARGMGGAQPTQALGVGIGLTGFTFVGGSFQGTADFNQGFGGTAPLTAAGSVDGFVAKFQDYFDAVPIAENDTFVYVPGTTLTVETTPGETLNSGYLADDPQRGGLGGLVPRIVTYPAHGTLSPGFYGDFTYTPNAGFTGTDSFTYQGADASLLSNVATVTLVSTGPYQNIEPIPNLTMYPGQSTLTVVLVGAEGGSQTIYSYSAQTTTQVPVTLAVNQYGVLTITPQAGFSGTFGVSATVSGSTDNFNVQVLANTPPTLASIANQSVAINTPLTVPLLATDPDEGGNSPADQTLTYSASIVGSSPPANLSITLNQLTITPTTGYQGTFTVQASVTDGTATTTRTFQVSIGNPATASFRKKDTTTQGNWIGAYGLQGYNIINHAVSYPSYATVSPSGQAAYTWAASTSDTRALEYPSGSGRIAAAWYSATSFSVNVNFTDGQTHELALYALDFDQKSRSEQIQISSASTGSVLDTETVSSFSGGVYLQWAISGNVVIKVTRTAGPNAVISGLFFDPNSQPADTLSVSGITSPDTAGTAQTITVTAIGPGGTTDANYRGTILFTSTDGKAVLPANYTFNSGDAGTHTFTLMATLKTAGTQSITATDMSNSAITGTESNINVVAAGASTLTLTGYPNPATAGTAFNFTVTAYDPYGNVATGYAGTIQFSSSDTKASLPGNYPFTSTDAGAHQFSATLHTTGTQSITATDMNSTTITGTASLTVNPATGATATLLKRDSTTQGNWIGVYGSKGYNVINSGVSYPSYATVSPSGQSTYTWAASTTDTRALENPSGSGRLATCWYASNSFSINVNFTDGQTHDLALYAVDFDQKGRSETIQITSSATGAVLDTETVSSYSGGLYLQWAISGNVVIKVTRTAGPNAVISGLFFD